MKKKIRWVKCSNRLPEEWDQVLVRRIGELHPFSETFYFKTGPNNTVLISNFWEPTFSEFLDKLEWLDEY